jgi:hypothetical protein
VSQLPGLLVGAFLAFAFSMITQFYVVPRIEARERREDRWERDVLALGELLTNELPRLALDARRDTYALQYLVPKLAEAESPTQRNPIVREIREKARTSVASYQSAAVSRVRWLVDRIVGFAPDVAELRMLGSRGRMFELQAMLCTFWEMEAVDFSADKFGHEWAEHDKRLIALTKEITQLARLPHPPRQPYRWFPVSSAWLEQQRSLLRPDSTTH